VGEIVSAAVPDAMTILGSDQVKTILENLVEEPQKARRTPSCPTYRPTPLAMK